MLSPKTMALNHIRTTRQLNQLMKDADHAFRHQNDDYIAEKLCEQFTEKLDATLSKVETRYALEHGTLTLPEILRYIS